MRLTKTNGSYIKIDQNEKSKGTKDIEAQAWCDDCETILSKEDRTGAHFLRDKSTLVNTQSLEKTHFSLEHHDPKESREIRKFLLSIPMRYYLDKASKREIVEDESLFIKVLNLYKKNLDADILITNFPVIRLANQEPLPDKNSIYYVLAGHLIQIFLDSKLIDKELSAIQMDKIMILKSDDPKHPFIQNLVELYSRTTLPKNR